MKSQEIQKGDFLLDDEGNVTYTVEQVVPEPPHVVAVVRFADGGTGNRMWEIGKDVPLSRADGMPSTNFVVEGMAKKKAIQKLQVARKAVEQAATAVSADAPQFYDDLSGLRADVEAMIRKVNGEPA
jgi:hypothetical protein